MRQSFTLGRFAFECVTSKHARHTIGPALHLGACARRFGLAIDFLLRFTASEASTSCTPVLCERRRGECVLWVLPQKNDVPRSRLRLMTYGELFACYAYVCMTYRRFGKRGRVITSTSVGIALNACYSVPVFGWKFRACRCALQAILEQTTQIRIIANKSTLYMYMSMSRCAHYREERNLWYRIWLTNCIFKLLLL